MFAVASILMVLGLWVVIACLLDWDTCAGVIDIRAASEAMGDDEFARWAIGTGGFLLLLVGVICTL